MFGKDKVLKMNFNNGKVNVSDVLDLEYFETYDKINSSLKNYLNNSHKEIKNGNNYLRSMMDIWDADFELKVKGHLESLGIDNILPMSLTEYKSLCNFACDKSFSYAIFESNAIDIVGVVALLMTITKEKDIDVIVKSKEFEVVLTMIKVYLDYVESYMSIKRENVKEFLLRKKIYGTELPTDFDGLNVLTWRFFRDYYAFNYACKQLAWKYRKLGKDVRDTLLALHLVFCMNQLNRLIF